MRVRALLVLFVALAAAGCGGGGSNDAGGTTDTVGTSPPATADTIKACLVSDVGRFNDKGFNQNQLTGLKRAEKELGIQTAAVESRAKAEYVPNLSSCARRGYDIVISAGFLLADATAKVAKQYPDTKFAITDYSVAGAPFNGSASPNVEGLTYASQENSYLVGCLAGLMVKKQGGRQTIGVVGGVKIPPVDTFLAGYQAGAKKCNPKIKVLIGYSQDFIDQAKCKTVAQNQIDQGSQVEFNVAGPCGLGTLDAANDAGIWGIGVDVDQYATHPQHILTSAVKRVDTGVLLAIQGAADGSFTGGEDATFDLENEGVGLGKVNPKVPQEFLDRIDDLKQQIIDGKLVPPTTVKAG
jgi:basic membrane protein A and related proteins